MLRGDPSLAETLAPAPDELPDGKPDGEWDWEAYADQREVPPPPPRRHGLIHVDRALGVPHRVAANRIGRVRYVSATQLL